MKTTIERMHGNPAGYQARRFAGLGAIISLCSVTSLGLRAADCPPMDESLRNYAPVSEGSHYACWANEEWAKPVDLDGDGEVDFWHRRLGAYQTWWNEELGLAANQLDQIEAFFPEPHVDIRGEYNPWD